MKTLSFIIIISSIICGSISKYLASYISPSNLLFIYLLFNAIGIIFHCWFLSSSWNERILEVLNSAAPASIASRDALKQPTASAVDSIDVNKTNTTTKSNTNQTAEIVESKVEEPTATGEPATSKVIVYDEEKEKAIAIIQDKFFNPENNEQWEVNKHMCVNEDPRACAIRSLLARRWSPEKASILIQNTLDWRKENNVDTILTKKIDPELLKTMRKYLYDDFHGCDKDGYPLYFNMAGKSDLQTLMKHVDIQSLVEYHIQCMEYNQKVWYPDCSNKAGFTVYKATMLLDLTGFGSNLANSTFMNTMITINTIDADYYYENINKVLILNANTFFSFFWRTVKGLLPIETQQKFIMLSSVKEIEKYIDREFIPVQYGGDYAGSNIFLNADERTISPHLIAMDKYIDDLINNRISTRSTNNIQTSKSVSSRSSNTNVAASALVPATSDRESNKSFSGEQENPVNQSTTSISSRSNERQGEIKILQGIKLAHADFFGLINPFCIVLWNHTELFRTRTRHLKYDPVWDKIGTASFPTEELIKPEDELEFQVYDENIGKDDTFLGCVILNRESLKDFFGTNGVEKIYKLQKSPILPSQQQKYVQGDLKVSFKWVNN